MDAGGHLRPAGDRRRRAGAGEEQTFRWTTQNPTGHPITQGGQKFADLVAQKSGGKMQVKLFPGGVLGGDVQVLSAVQGGTVDMFSMNSGILQGQVKEFAIVDFPFLFNDAKESGRGAGWSDREDAGRQAAGEGPRAPRVSRPGFPQSDQTASGRSRPPTTSPG